MEIDRMLSYTYGTRYSLLVLTLLYSDNNWKDKTYNEDHIFPKSEFTQKKLAARGSDDNRIQAYLDNYNTILNLELLTEKENKSKNAKAFVEWINSRDDNFKTKHHIPDMDDYSFDKFLDFILKRKEILIESILKFSFKMKDSDLK